MNAFVSKLGVIVSTTVILVFIGITQFFHSRGHGPGEFDVQLTQLPMTLGGWNGMEADALSAKAHDILRLDQFVRRLYKNDRGDQVFVYIGYWQKQSGEHQAAKHSPLMCLPANGWKISQPELREISYSSGTQPARHLVGKFKDHDLLFYYWFFSGEKTYVDETSALWHILRETITHARSDGGIVEVSIELDKTVAADEALAKAEQVMQEFSKEFAPALNALLRQKRR